jgi:hypothetical protein
MISRNQDGEFIFSVDESEEFEGALKEVLATTEIGKKYRKEYFTKERGDEDAEKLVDAALAVAKDTTGQPLISRPILERALTLLIDSGKIQPKNLQAAQQLEEPEADSRPRDRNGKLLTPQQIAWSEMTRFAAEATPDQIRQRRHTDSVFADYVRHNLRLEMQSQEVGDAVVPAGKSTTKARASQELVAFAQKYTHEPTANLRPKGGYVTLAGDQIPWATFNDLLSRASAANLI